MIKRTSTVLTTLQNVQAFMTANAQALGSLNSSDSRKALDALEATLSTHAANQTRAKGGGKAAVARQRALKSALLVKHLRPISATAEAQLIESPNFIALKLPKNIRTTPQLLAAAKAMGDAAATYTDTFVKAGLAPTFLTDLQAAAEAVKEGSATRGTSLTSQIGATSGLKVATSRAHKIVKQLDALIVPMIAEQPALAAQWKATKRFSGKVQQIGSSAVEATENTKVPEDPGSAPRAAGGAHDV